MKPLTPSTPVAPALKLVDALRLMAANPAATVADTFRVALVCGFAPLHLQTFLGAQLRLRYPEHHIEIVTGLFDDVAGTLGDAVKERFDAVALVLEWADLDPRLGLRRLGGWSPRQLADIVRQAQARLQQLQTLVTQVAANSPTVVALPTLPLPPLFFTPGWHAAVDELRLRNHLSSFAATVSQESRIRVISEQTLSLLSPLSERLSVKSTWTSGFPYRTPHAARLAELLGCAIHHKLPKKGLITDLDDTLWGGIVGDDGPNDISWDLDHHTQAHGLYQQFLSALSEEGVLVGVASKNDPAIVDVAFAREDLLLSRQRVFPCAIGWGSKAEAVSQVLSAWNVSANDVVFVDDNPIELEEVKAAHPGIECVHFPHDDAQAVYDLLVRLRDLFGRSALSHEDQIRVDSLRHSVVSSARLSDSDGYSEALLQGAEAELTLEFSRDGRDSRALELVNKTNQFNLNGRRFTERAWIEYLETGRFLLTANYTDRFGALGKIAVIAGRQEGGTVQVDTWVMSCRAFARRIEHQCLKAVFDRFAAGAVTFEYRATERNGPLTRFLTELIGNAPAESVTLTMAAFDGACPALFHRLVIRDDLGNEQQYANAAR